jgi:2,5-diketo-D-gluconate reductase A
LALAFSKIDPAETAEAVSEALKVGYRHIGIATRRALVKRYGLGSDYVDLFLIHWPLPTLYWRALEEFYRRGHARSIGVSNFQVSHLWCPP